MPPESIQTLERLLAPQIDSIDFETILLYHDAPISEISQVVLVDGDIPLERVGAAIEGLTVEPAACRRLLQEWLDAAEIRVLRTPSEPPNAPRRSPQQVFRQEPIGAQAERSFFRRDEVPSDRLVRCLYLPPVYVIKLA